MLILSHFFNSLCTNHFVITCCIAPLLTDTLNNSWIRRGGGTFHALSIYKRDFYLLADSDNDTQFIEILNLSYRNFRFMRRCQGKVKQSAWLLQCHQTSVKIRRLNGNENFKNSVLKEYFPICTSNGADITYILKLRTKTMLKSLLEGIKVNHPCDNEGLHNFISFHVNRKKNLREHERQEQDNPPCRTVSHCDSLPNMWGNRCNAINCNG